MSHRIKMEKEIKMCCKEMKFYAMNHCTVHDSQFDCPDCLIFYDKKRDSFGIIIHDGGHSYVRIGYCPWCGSKIPSKKRRLKKLWFHRKYRRLLSI